MMRRILLVLTTTAVLMTGFYFYSKYARLDVVPTRHLPATIPARPLGDPTSERSGLPSNVDGLLIVGRDETGRLEAIYRAKQLHRLPDGSHHLVEPRVELYQKNGQRMILRADEGDVYGEQLDRGANIRRAKLRGNVTLYFDPSTEPDRKPVEDRLEEVIRIHADDVEFDREHLSVYTEGRVTVFSPQADVYGRGLSVTWNESPRELRMLRIEHGQYMAVYNVPAEMNVFSLPGGQGEITAPGRAGRAGPTSGPATRPAGAGSKVVIAAAGGATPKPAAKPTVKPAVKPAAKPAPRDADDVVAKKRKHPATTQPAASQPVKPKPLNQFLADFNEHVKVVQRDRKMYGADKLELRFDWDDSWRKSSDGYVGSIRRRKREEAASQPATAPTTQAAATARPGGPASAPAKPGKTSAKPAKAGEPSGSEPLEVFWTGPLVLRPTGFTETPSRERYEVSATGGKVVLSDPRATATCREFVFRKPEQSGWLKAPADDRVRLLLAEGADVACREIRFDPAAGWALLDGAGYMARRFGKGMTQDQAIELAETEDPNRAPASERITWQKNVDLAFEQDNTPKADGKLSNRQFIRQADFHEGVVLLQSGDPNGETVQCKDLTVLMAHGKKVSAYPREAIATGNVYARQEGSDIRARKITVRFRESEAGKPGMLAAPDALGGRVEPSWILAEGDVSLHDQRDRDAEKLTATADRLTSDLVERTAVLVGNPARIDRGPNHLAGPEIKLCQTDGSAVVDGKGDLSFLTNKDINGNSLDKARPVHVDWTRGMTFQGERRIASFKGNVVMDGGNDHMACQEMQMIFSESEPEKPKAPKAGKAGPTTRPAGATAIAAAGAAALQPATAPADTAVVAVATVLPGIKPKAKAPGGPAVATRPGAGSRLRGMAVGMERYSRRRITMILAERDVVLQSHRENEQGQLLRRLRLDGDKLIYNAEGGRMTMLGHGTMVAEDYDKPRPRRPAESDPMAAGIDRPSQTAFEWSRSMQLTQKDRVAELDGNVRMIHRSAQQINLTDQINVPRQLWGKLPEGRKTVLDCRSLMAKFGEARKDREPPASGPATSPGAIAATAPTTGPATRPGRRSTGDIMEKGPDLGPLDLFNATGDVVLRDGPRQVLAQRLIYNRLNDQVLVHGYLEGSPSAKALLLLEDPKTGHSQSWNAPKIIWSRQDNKITTEEVSGSGVK